MGFIIGRRGATLHLTEEESKIRQNHDSRDPRFSVVVMRGATLQLTEEENKIRQSHDSRRPHFMVVLPGC